MSFHALTPYQYPLTVVASVAMALLTACRQELPQPPLPSTDPSAQATPNADLRGASDGPGAAPAVGAMTSGDQATGGAHSGAMQPSGGDGRAAASAPSFPPASAPASAPASSPIR